MRLYLQSMPGGATALRFVQLVLEQDLLGGWTLYRESGTQGGRSHIRREQFLQQADALSAFEKARDAQLKRGFRIMFTQGQDGSHAH